MTDNDKSKSKPHTFSRRIETCDPGARYAIVGWVPEAEAQEKISELENTVRLRGERLDAYVEEIERLREVVTALGLRLAQARGLDPGLVPLRRVHVPGLAVDVGRVADVSSVVTLRYRPDNGGTWEIVDVRSTGPGPVPAQDGPVDPECPCERCAIGGAL